MSIQCPLEQNLSTLAQVSLVIPSPLFMGSDSLEDGPVGPQSRIDAVTSPFGSEASSNVLFKLTCFLKPLKCGPAVGLVSVLRDDKETHGAEPPICLGMGLFSMQSPLARPMRKIGNCGFGSVAWF